MEDDLDEEETIGSSFAEVKGRQVQTDMQQAKTAMPSLDKQMQARVEAIPQEQINSLLSQPAGEQAPPPPPSNQGEQ